RTRQNGTQQQAKDGIEDSGGNGYSDDVVDKRPEEILPHRAHRAARERDAVGDRGEIGSHEGDVARVDRDVGPGAEGEADVSLREGGSVVDTVADHGDDVPPVLQT